MSKKIYVGLLVILLVSLSIPIFPINSQDNPVLRVYRGANYIDTDNGDGTHTWESASQWVYDGSEYVPYILENFGNYYTVQSGLIGAEIHRGKAIFYDPQLENVAVGRETWLVYKNVDGVWNPVAASLQSYFTGVDIIEGDEYVSVTGTWETPKGILSIEYLFRENLKHTVTWTPNQAGKYAIVQFWNDTHYSDVTLGDNTIIKRTNDAIIGKTDSLMFLFHDETQPFGVFEDQWSAQDYFHKTIFAKGTVNYQGISITDGVAWIFYNSSLCDIGSGESIVIDPATTTLNNPMDDGYIKRLDSGSYTKVDNSNVLMKRTDLDTYTARGYVEWNISSIPDDAIILDVDFLYEGVLNAEDCHIHENTGKQPSTVVTEADEAALYSECGGGTSYVNPAGFPVDAENQEVDLGVTAGVDLEAQLTAGDWFAIGIQLDSEANPVITAIASEDEPGVPVPTLRIVWTLVVPPTITSATITDMDDVGNCYTMKKYYTFVVVVEDARGADNITDVYLQGRQDAAIRFEVRATNLDGAPVYSIESGAAAIDLDTVSCSWGEAGDVGTATFTIRFEWDYAQEDDGDLAVYVEDDAGNSTGFTVIQTDYFDVISRLTTTGFEATRNYVVRGGLATLFGYVRYATTATGDVSSTSYPPDSLFTAVHIHNSVDVSQGSDTTIVDGYFRVTFNIPDEIQANSYHVYLDMTG